MTCQRWSYTASRDINQHGERAAYGLVGLITDLLAHELIHPLVGLIVIATVGREAGNDERHVCDEFVLFWLAEGLRIEDSVVTRKQVKIQVRLLS
jgi:hypothetical protein